MNLLPLDLGDHLLWADGIVQVSPEKVIDFTFRLANAANKLSVTEITPEIQQFNQFSDYKLVVKDSIDLSKFPPEWTIPPHYLTLDLDDYLLSLCDNIAKDGLYEARLTRLAEEIFTFKQHNLDQVLRVLIYIVDRMKEANVVWGVGRGSSCSSYLLYLMGLHEIDAVLYDISLSDFLRP